MIWLTLLLLGTASGAAAATRCTLADRAVFAEEGATFPVRFRALGGLTVSRARYVSEIVDETGLSAGCAECYGDAYMCGWNHCKWPCRSASEACDACLTRNRCIEQCERCTGFFISNPPGATHAT